MRRLLLPIWLAAALLGPCAARAQTAAPLTLDQALALAARQSPLLSAARREVEAAGGAVDQAGLRRNPTLSASVEDFRRATRTTTATLDFPLELGGKRALRVFAAERARELAEVELDNARAQVRASVVAAYFEVLLAQERAQLAADSAVLTGSGAEAVGKRVAAGKVSPVDGIRARVDEANAQLEAAEAQEALAGARRALALLWGDEAPAFGRVDGDAGAVPERPALPELMRQLEGAPDLRLARAEIERRRSLAAVERSKATPDLTLSIGAKRDNELGRTQAIVAVSVPLPFFDRNQGAIREAGRRADKAEDDHQAARLRLRSELQAATSRLAIARITLAALHATVLPAAQQAQEAARRGFDAGKFGLIDVIDAQRALLNARARQLGALASAHQAAAAIDRLLGH